MRRASTVEVAKMVRKALNRAFPKTQFSVRSKKYSGGSSITAHWIDGPTVAQVEPILDSFEGASFDGMIDLKSYREPVEVNGELVDMGADYVFSARSESIENLKAAAFRVAYECDLPLLHICEQGYVDSENKHQTVPFKYFPKDDVIAHCSWQGESYDRLVYQVARNTSYEQAQDVSMPQRVTDEYITEKVRAMVS